MVVNESLSSPRTDIGADLFPLPVLLLVSAVAAGVAAQGGHYPLGRLLVAVLVGAALVTARPAVASLSRWDVGPVMAACAALAAWALVRAAAGGSVAAGVPTAMTVGCVAAA